MSSSSSPWLENPPACSDIDFIKWSDQMIGDNPPPSPRTIEGVIDQVIDEFAGDDDELRGRVIGRLLDNLRVLGRAEQRILSNQKKAKEAASGDHTSSIQASTSSNEVKTDEK